MRDHMGQAGEDNTNVGIRFAILRMKVVLNVDLDRGAHCLAPSTASRLNLTAPPMRTHGMMPC